MTQKIFVTVALTLALSISVSQAAINFIYHDTATTTGGEFNASFPIENLKNAGHTAGTDTENTAATSESYATANSATGGFPVTITLNFNEAVDLTDFYVWNHSNNNSGETNGIGAFTLTFFDAVSGGGSQIGSVYNGTAVATTSADNADYAAQAFDFGGTYASVRSVELAITNKANGAASGFVAIRELGFEAVPEPSSLVLIGLTLGAFLLKRRR